MKLWNNLQNTEWYNIIVRQRRTSEYTTSLENSEVFFCILSAQVILQYRREIEIDAELHLATSWTRWKSCYPFYALFLVPGLYFSHDSIPITSTKSEIILLAAPRNRIHIPRDFRDCWELPPSVFCVGFALIYKAKSIYVYIYIIFDIRDHFPFPFRWQDFTAIPDIANPIRDCAS